MKATGRNDPCPCGSGKKYKKCCLASAEANDFTYRRQRNLESDLIRRITEYTFGIHDLGSFQEAWHEFNNTDEVEMIAPDSPMMMVFMPWFLFSWVFEAVDEKSGQLMPTTNAQSFAQFHKSELTDEECEFLESADNPLYSLCEVVQTRPGIGLILRDLLTDAEVEISERSASQTLHAGHIIYCATMEMRGVKSNLATAPYPLRPTAKRDVLELRKAMLRKTKKRKVTTDHLIAFEDDIRNLYLNKLDEMMAPPRLVNTDKEPMLFQKLYFELKSVDEAFHLLKDLDPDTSEADRLAKATIREGKIVSVNISWTGGSDEARKRHGGSILLGLLKLTEDQLIAEVNSSARAEKIRKIIEERLGELVRYKTTLLEPIEGAIDEMWEEAKSAETKGATGKRRVGRHSPLNQTGVVSDSDEQFFIDLEDPAVRELMEKVAKDQWNAWFDLPVPALNDMTPREAARTKEGRDLLESLLLEYEIRNEAAPDALCPDVPAMRRELGLLD